VNLQLAKGRYLLKYESSLPAAPWYLLKVLSVTESLIPDLVVKQTGAGSTCTYYRQPPCDRSNLTLENSVRTCGKEGL
jgi:hypothetical protein